MGLGNLMKHLRVLGIAIARSVLKLEWATSELPANDLAVALSMQVCKHEGSDAGIGCGLPTATARTATQPMAFRAWARGRSWCRRKVQLSSHASSRTSIPRELLVESVRQPYEVCPYPRRRHATSISHTQNLKCRDKSWKYHNRWKDSALLDDEHTWVDSTMFGQYQCW
jgi:hypothetical protein